MKHHTLTYSPTAVSGFQKRSFFFMSSCPKMLTDPSVCTLLIVYTTHWPYFGVEPSTTFIILLWRSLCNCCSIGSITELTCMVLQLQIKSTVMDHTAGEMYPTQCVLWFTEAQWRLLKDSIGGLQWHNCGSWDKFDAPCVVSILRFKIKPRLRTVQ